MNGRFGSLAAIHDNINPMTAFGGKADVEYRRLDANRVAAFGHKRSFLLLLSNHESRLQVQSCEILSNLDY
jgi:hypothetical protein